MKLQTLQVIQIFIECRNIVGGASVRVSKRSLFRLEITVGCRLCAYPNIRVCGVWYVWCEGGVCACVCVCVLKWLCVCVESVWDVRFVFWCCGVLLCVLCVLCVGLCVGLCLWCGVCGFVLFLFLFSLSNNDNDHSCSRLSLCTQGSELPQGPECMDLGPFLVGRTCSHHARNNCPGLTVQALCHLEWSGPVSVLEMGVVFGGVWCSVVVCGSMW